MQTSTGFSWRRTAARFVGIMGLWLVLMMLTDALAALAGADWISGGLPRPEQALLYAVIWEYLVTRSARRARA